MYFYNISRVSKHLETCAYDGARNVMPYNFVAKHFLLICKFLTMLDMYVAK